jgi:hypothetical protein
MHVAMGAIEHHLALFEARTLHEPEVDLLAGEAGHTLIIIFVIVAPIARAEIADGQEREIMIMRQAVEEWRGAAVDDDAVLLGRPEIGADQEVPRLRVEQDDLRAVMIGRQPSGAGLLELLDDKVAEEAAIIGQLLQRQPPRNHARLVVRIERSGLQHLDEVAELDPLLGFGANQAGH